MIASEARAAAARLNSQKSTGPRTAEGKERSRANSYQHGMTGAGVVLSPGDAAEVGRRAEAFRAELEPRGEYQSALARQAAVLSVRLDRCAAHEAEATASRVRHAGAEFEEAREAEADRLMKALFDDPAGNLRRLRRMPEGVDRLVAAWSEIRLFLGQERAFLLGPEVARRVSALSGRGPGSIGASRAEVLVRGIQGIQEDLEPGELDGVPPIDHRRWCRDRLVEWIDAEIAGLAAHRATLDHAAIAADRAGAATLALFDPSKEATLARRYEAAASREFHRAIRELKAARKADPAGKVAPACQAPPLASFSPATTTPARPPRDPALARPGLPADAVPMTIGRPPGPPR